jgi:phosphate transport system ATP-binding protein
MVHNLTDSVYQECKPKKDAVHLKGERGILEVENLSAWYGNTLAIKNISMSINSEAITAIIGPSGCGKSTFIRCLNRMHEVSHGGRVEGCILLDGRDIYARDIDPVVIRRRIGMVFQKPTPFPTMSIFDNVAAGLRLTRIWSRRWELAARALAVEPEIILLDEPCSALDPAATLKIEDLMRNLAQEYTIITVTHNMQQAARVSDMAAFFLMDSDRSGVLVEYGKTSQLFTNPKDKRTEDYITGRFG